MWGMTTLPLFLISIICFSAIAFAGNLTPPAGSPTPTMFSLEQIYNSIAGSSYDSSGFNADVDGNVHEQLKYIANIISTRYTYGDEDPDFVLTTADGAGNYDAINLTPENVANGVSFGVGQTGTLEEGFEYGDDNPEYVAGTADGAGTLLVNLTHGSSGKDDYNNGGSPAPDRYATSWTKCNSGNSYCGTSDNRASAMDNVTGLIWSYPCSGTGCSNMTNETAGTYNWSTARTNCLNQSPWWPPTQKELMVAYVNGAYGNNALEIQGTNRSYWSSTLPSAGPTAAWHVNLSQGITTYSNMLDLKPARCVRLAP